ncbi:unnamed protein product [Cochlearia groenlandica]
MGNCLSISDHSLHDLSEKNLKALPVETQFKFPSPLPTWPQDGGFAKQTIDLGGLEVSQVTTFEKVWSTYEGGPGNLGATFFEPSSIPHGFSILGYYAQPNNRKLFGWVLTAKDLSNNTLKPPLDYTLVGTTESIKIKQDGPGYIWQPVPPDGYRAVGLLVTKSSQKPPLDKLRCVRSDLTEQCETDTLIWESNGVNVSSLRPTTRGTQAKGVYVGTFNWQSQALSCLKNTRFDFSTMPNRSQIETLFDNFSPLIYLHPEEEYLPSSVNWYFNNGALLYEKDQESKPIPIESNGSNLPRGGSNDESYWIDLPIDKGDKERVKKGDLQGNTRTYLHIKPMLGATFTDIAIWIFYPYNGPARAKVKFVNIPLGKIGEHVGDWEHATLRISNFNGELWRVFLSQHSGGVWIEACDLEFEGGGRGRNKPVAYASLHGHAMYARPGLVLQGEDGIGIRNDTARSEKVIDTGLGYDVIAAEYDDGGVVAEKTPWVNYMRKWGPKIDYNVDEDVKRIAKVLPWALKKAFVNFAKKIPNEVYGEDGPTGPKLKGNWAGDEN